MSAATGAAIAALFNPLPAWPTAGPAGCAAAARAVPTPAPARCRSARWCCPASRPPRTAPPPRSRRRRRHHPGPAEDREGPRRDRRPRRPADQLGEDRDLARRSRSPPPQQKRGRADRAAQGRSRRRRRAAAAAMRDAAALPPGTLGSGLLGLDALAQMQRGESATAGGRRAARQLAGGAARGRAAPSSRPRRATLHRPRRAVRPSCNAELAKKQAAQQKLEQEHAAEIDRGRGRRRTRPTRAARRGLSGRRERRPRRRPAGDRGAAVRPRPARRPVRVVRGGPGPVRLLRPDVRGLPHLEPATSRWPGCPATSTARPATRSSTATRCSPATCSSSATRNSWTRHPPRRDVRRRRHDGRGAAYRPQRAPGPGPLDPALPGDPDLRLGRGRHRRSRPRPARPAATTRARPRRRRPSPSSQARRTSRPTSLAPSRPTSPRRRRARHDASARASLAVGQPDTRRRRPPTAPDRRRTELVQRDSAAAVRRRRERGSSASSRQRPAAPRPSRRSASASASASAIDVRRGERRAPGPAGHDLSRGPADAGCAHERGCGTVKGTRPASDTVGTRRSGGPMDERQATPDSDGQEPPAARPPARTRASTGTLPRHRPAPSGRPAGRRSAAGRPRSPALRIGRRGPGKSRSTCRRPSPDGERDP